MTRIGEQPARFESRNTPDIRAAVSDVTRLIDAQGMGWASRTEVLSAATRLAALDPQGADSAVDVLARAGLLDNLAREVMDTSWVGPGLTADQRAAFMVDMAGRLDGQTLANLSAAFSRTDPATGGYTPVTELAQAVARHASPAARLAYVQALAGQTTDLPTHPVGGLMQLDGQRRLGDAEARAVAEVLASFRDDPTSARAAFAAVSSNPGAMEAVMTAAMNTEQDWGLLNGWHTATSDRSTYRSLMQTATNMEQAFPGDASVRALGQQVFNAASAVIDPRDVQAADLVFRATPMDAAATLMAEISDAVYQRTGSPDGTRRLNDAELAALGIDPQLLHIPAIGFEAGLYARDDGSHVLAFRGTDSWSLALSGDTDDNLAQGAGFGSLQHAAASILAMEVAQSLGTEGLHITGHSLGGGLAATAAGRIGVAATTFNAAGVAAESISGYSLAFTEGQVVNYRTTGDIMSHLNGQPAPTRYAALLGLDGLRDFPDSVGTNIDLGNPVASIYLNQRLESLWPGAVIEGGRFGGEQHLMGEVLRHRQP